MRGDQHTRGGYADQPASDTIMVQEPFKAILFDLDSTLCRYRLTVAEVIEQALDRIGVKAQSLGSPESLAKDYNVAWWTAEDTLDLPTNELRRAAWKVLLERRGVEDPELAVRVADAYSTVREETGLELFEGARGLLQALRGRYRVGILTNGPSDMQWTKLRDLELVDAVDAIVVAGDLGIFKPDPRPFQQLLEVLDADASDGLFVGDSYEHDIVGARSVGLRTAWVTPDGAQTPDGLPVDFVVNHATDLREVLL